MLREPFQRSTECLIEILRVGPKMAAGVYDPPLRLPRLLVDTKSNIRWIDDIFCTHDHEQGGRTYEGCKASRLILAEELDRANGNFVLPTR
jgi:hypothetical protein